MRRLKYQMSFSVNHCALALCITAPQHKHQVLTTCIEQCDYLIREQLPAFTLMGIGIACLYSEHSIEQEDPLVCPGAEIAMSRNLQPQISI